MEVASLHAAISAVCPIIGVSVGLVADKTTWRVDFADAATSDQIAAAQSVIVSFDPSAPAVPNSISDRQFFQQLAVAGIITQADALASNAAVIPPPLLAIIDAMPVDQQFGAKMIISGATIYNRTDPLTIGIGTAYGWTSAQIDAFFQSAALL